MTKTKPDPEPFLIASRKLDVSPDECAYAGDSPTDMIAARRTGMVAIGIATGKNSEEELKDAGANRVFRNLEELKDYLTSAKINLKF